MITDGFVGSIILIVKQIWNRIPDSEGFPADIDVAIQTAAGYLHSIDFIFPIGSLVDVVQIYIGMWIISLPFIAVLFAVKMWNKV